MRDLLSLGAVLALLVAVSLLPPDTSLREVHRVATLKACVPPAYPPLVTGDPDRPGLDVELLRAVAEHLGVALVLAENPAMGRDFNPRNWGLNRAQCEIIAGGVVDSPQTRSFVETGPAYASTGWALVSPAPIANLAGARLGVLVHISGLDRIGLASFLRAQGAQAKVVTQREALIEAIGSGALDGGVTEALLASGIAGETGWRATWMPPELARYNLVFGLWKGDLTLKRAVDAAFAAIAADGTLEAIRARYAGSPLD